MTTNAVYFLFSAFLVFFTSGLQPARSQTRPDKKLTQKLEKLLSGFEGTAGVYVYHLKKNREAAVHADTIFPTASIVKVPILAGIFDKIDKGELNYHQPLLYRDSRATGGSGIMQFFKDSTEIDLSIPVTLMISHSDNVASLWCQELAGGGEAINRLMEKAGLQYTRVNSRTKGRDKDYDKYGWGQTTPREMTQLLVLIRQHQLVSAEASERMYRNLTNIYWDDYALSQVPPYIQTASKQGMVNASRSELVMVNAPHGDYVFYIATKNNKDQRWRPDNEAWQLAREVSKIIWNHYEPHSRWKEPQNAQTYWDWPIDKK